MIKRTFPNKSWDKRQLIPESWLRHAVQTAPSIRLYAPKEQWKYGHGFWSNEYDQLFPSLPLDSFSAQGAGSQQIWVCPSLDLVVVQSPGVCEKDRENAFGLLRYMLDAIALHES